MKKQLARFKFWIFTPSWIIWGSMAVLVPMLIFMTYQGVRIQHDLTTRFYVEKGEALIRSFEAGIRTGSGLNWGDFQIQKLLIETAQQPGIDYLVVTDAQGRIVADSDPSQVGLFYRAEIVHLPLEKIRYRQVGNTGGTDTFEVYRYLSSTVLGEPLAWVIYVGLDMEPVVKARQQNFTRLTVTALILLLVAFAGLVSISLAQGVRTARSSLARMRAFSETLAENMPIGLIGISQDGVISLFNRTAAELIRWPAERALNKQAEEVLSPILTSLQKDLHGAKSGSVEVLQKEIEYPVGDSSRKPLDIIAAVLKDENKNPRGLIILLRDLTELKRLQKEIERSQRLASVGSLAAGVAHELRNPLSSIKGFATYFRERYRNYPDDVKNADIMIQEVERLDRVIGQLLEFSRPLNLKKTKGPLEEIILHTLKLVEKQAKDRGISIVTRIFPSETAEITFDHDKIKQVLLNLLLNAIEAMKKGGMLSVEMKRNHNHIEILVTDTGIGMPEDNLARIFDPYFTTKPTGTGLGLAIAHKIIEAHDGLIRIESEPEKGTTVVIALPFNSPGEDRMV